MWERSIKHPFDVASRPGTLDGRRVSVLRRRSTVSGFSTASRRCERSLLRSRIHRTVVVPTNGRELLVMTAKTAINRPAMESYISIQESTDRLTGVRPRADRRLSLEDTHRRRRAKLISTPGFQDLTFGGQARPVAITFALVSPFHRRCDLMTSRQGTKLSAKGESCQLCAKL